MSKKFLKRKTKPSKNDEVKQLRVLYKKVGQVPQIKIIKDIPNFKKAIILNKLNIIPYKKVFIICNNQDYKMPINVFFSLYHIEGDLIVIDIDKEKREFKSLSQDQLLYYSKDLIGRNPNCNPNEVLSQTRKIIQKKENYTPFERDIEADITQVRQSDFEKTIIHILINIELMLANLLKNNDYGDDEDYE